MGKYQTSEDPREHLKISSIPEQTQEEPGLDSKLEPRAEHGEELSRMCQRFEGKKVLITGGDSGIGRAVAIAFAKEGASVAISYLPTEQEDAAEVAKVIEREGQKAILLPGDLRDELFGRKIVHLAHGGLGGLDIVINNAGKQIYNDQIETIPSDQIVDTFKVNVFAMFWIVQEVIKYLKPGSAIVNTTSIQATQPSAGLVDYASTKGAIATFTKGLAQQLTPKGIRVNAVAPGPIWTPLQPSHGQPQKKLVSFGEDTPLGRPGQPAELAGTYLFLASEEASYISGEIISVTGGKLT